MSNIEIKIYDKNGEMVYDDRLTSLPVREECIESKSIELFNDSRPCIIHRTFITKKCFLELDSFFRKMIDEDRKEIHINDLPEWVTDILEIRNVADKLIIG